MVITSNDVNTIVQTPGSVSLGGLARLLVSNNLIDQETAAKAVDQAHKSEISLIAYLIENKLVRAVDVARLASKGFNLPLFDISALELDPNVLQLVDEKLIRRHRVLPLYKRGGRLFIGLSDPTNTRALEDIKFQTGLNTEPVVVVDTPLNDLIERALDSANDALGALDDDLDNVDIATEVDNKGQMLQPNRGMMMRLSCASSTRRC